MGRSRLRRSARMEAKRGDFSGRLVTLTEPSSSASEAYRTLRTNLFYSLIDTPPRVIALTSYGPMEGKSTTCANLGVVLAQAEKNTLVVDCDLRKPTLHKIFSLRNFRGLVNVLAGESSLEEAWQETLQQNLNVLTVGPIPPNPAELLSSRRFADLISTVRERFDYVLMDAPPIELVSDAAILGTQADGILLVLDARKTRKREVQKAVRSMQTVGASILGTVMNNADPITGYYNSDYTYG